MQTIPFSQARAHLADTLNQVEASTEPTLISRRGQSAAVLMSVAQYQQLSEPMQDFDTQLHVWRARYLGDAQPDEADSQAEADPWAAVRDRAEGRGSPW